MGEEMSFSEDVKKELCKIEPCDFWHLMSETYGMMLFSKNFSEQSIVFLTENKILADKFIDLNVKLTGSIVDIKTKLSFRDKNKTLYSLSIPHRNHRQNILNLFHMTDGIKIDKRNFYNESCISDFLRGVFLSCGRISDPNKEYRLEFDISHKELINDFVDIIDSLKNIEVKVNISKRNGTGIVYIKDNEQISELLTLIGAKNSAMNFIQVKMIKEVRNYVNRTTNFQTANISKTAAASVIQIEAINNIKKKRGLGYLSDELKAVAEIRLAYPEFSLKELGEVFPVPISRSGLNHRLNKIIEISKSIGD